MTLAWHGDPALRDDLLARVERHVAADTLVVGAAVWDGRCGSPMGVSIEGDDAALYAERFGFPLALAGLLDPLAARFHEPGAAQRFARDWILGVAPGARLSPVPTQIALDLLDAPETRGLLPAVTERLEALHRRELTGERVARGEWSPVRRDILLRLDERLDRPHRRLLELCDALCWSARTSRSVLAEGMRYWLYLSEIEPDPDWNEDDHLRSWSILERLAKVHGPRVEAGEQVNYPALFAQEDASLAARFEANLARVNAKGPIRRDAFAALVLRRIAEAA